MLPCLSYTRTAPGKEVGLDVAELLLLKAVCMVVRHEIGYLCHPSPGNVTPSLVKLLFVNVIVEGTVSHNLRSSFFLVSDFFH